MEVSDRFHVKPLPRSLTFTQTAFLLELALGSVRLLEIVPDLRAAEVSVPGMPTDVADAVGFARQVDQAIRPILADYDGPLSGRRPDKSDSGWCRICRSAVQASVVAYRTPGGKGRIPSLPASSAPRSH